MNRHDIRPRLNDLLAAADDRARDIARLVPSRALHRAGLEHRRSTLSRVLVVGAALTIGAAIGAGAVLLWAPSSGRRLRARLAARARRLRERIGTPRPSAGATAPRAAPPERTAPAAVDAALDRESMGGVASARLA